MVDSTPNVDPFSKHTRPNVKVSRNPLGYNSKNSCSNIGFFQGVYGSFGPPSGGGNASSPLSS